MSSLPTDYCTSEYLHAKGSLDRLRNATLDDSSAPLMQGGRRPSSSSSSGGNDGNDDDGGARVGVGGGSIGDTNSSNTDDGGDGTPSKATTSTTISDSGRIGSVGTLHQQQHADHHASNYQVQRLKGLRINYSKMVKKRPFIIGVCGGSASGKTTVCTKIVASLSHNQRVVIISQDSFYKSLGEEDKQLAHKSEYNFDHPDAFDYGLFESTVERLSQGKSVQIPVYDFVTHSRLPETSDLIMGVDVVIVEGILNFYSKPLRDFCNLKIFVDTDADTRLVRRIRRDIIDRGRDLNSILVQYERFVKPSFDDYILPTKKYADIIIPRGGTNVVAINLLIEHIKVRLHEVEEEFPAEKFKMRM